MNNNKLSHKIERALSKYAISNITLYLIICYAFGYLIQLVNSDFIQYMTLEPGKILRGQIWRLLTWIVIPPATSNIFFVLIMLYFYYSIGSILERIWGTYRLNVYLFQGLIFTILGSFLLYIILPFMGYNNVGFGIYFSTYYINMSLFLAYAATLPDMQVLLFFIIPIKVKYLGIVYGALLIFECLQGGLVVFVIVGSSLLNFLVFFVTSRSKLHRSPKQMKQKMEYTRQMRKADDMKRITKHKCAVCGQTDESNPNLEFRFCSKCNGNYEYCSEHLFSHEHVK